MLHTTTQGYLITQSTPFTVHELISIEGNRWNTVLFEKFAFNHALSLLISFYVIMHLNKNLPQQ
jgi:hypothetical protein